MMMVVALFSNFDAQDQNETQATGLMSEGEEGFVLFGPLRKQIHPREWGPEHRRSAVGDLPCTNLGRVTL